MVIGSDCCSSTSTASSVSMTFSAMRQGMSCCSPSRDASPRGRARATSFAATAAVSATIATRVALPCRVASEELRVTAAIGVSVYPEDGRTVGELLERADAEMYRVKASGDPGEAPVMSAAPRRRSEDNLKRS
jgi:GGDEF domain-containing protein